MMGGNEENRGCGLPEWERRPRVGESTYDSPSPLSLLLSPISIGMFNHAIRITLPYADVKDVISKWADRCHDAIAYQHDADGEVSKTHVHIGLGGCEVKAEALKRMWPDAPGKGNEFWSFKEWVRKDKTEWQTTPDTYMVYMAKGTLRPVFVKNISNDLVEKSRQSWVEPVKADKTGDNSERIVKKVYDKIVSEFVYRDLSDDDRYERVECSAETLLKLVRSETFRQLWGEHRRFPHASHYKIVAGTVYMRLCEHYNCFEEGMQIISELWL